MMKLREDDSVAHTDVDRRGQSKPELNRILNGGQKDEIVLTDPTNQTHLDQPIHIQNNDISMS